MEDVLDLYTEPYDPKRPVVCFDETSTELLADTRPPLLAQPGRSARQDYEYRREGGSAHTLAGFVLNMDGESELHALFSSALGRDLILDSAQPKFRSRFDEYWGDAPRPGPGRSRHGHARVQPVLRCRGEGGRAIRGAHRGQPISAWSLLPPGFAPKLLAVPIIPIPPRPGH